MIFDRIKSIHLHIVIITVIFIFEFAVPTCGNDDGLPIRYLWRQYTPDDTRDALYYLGGGEPPLVSKRGAPHRSVYTKQSNWKLSTLEYKFNHAIM